MTPDKVISFHVLFEFERDWYWLHWHDYNLICVLVVVGVSIRAIVENKEKKKRREEKNTTSKHAVFKGVDRITICVIIIII